MHKLVVLLRGSSVDDRMERQWSEAFVPLAERMPGLRRVLVGRAAGSPGGRADVAIVHEFLFDDLPALQAAMTSPEGQAAGHSLIQLAGDRAELFFAEHHEMDLDTSSEPGSSPGR